MKNTQHALIFPETKGQTSEAEKVDQSEDATSTTSESYDETYQAMGKYYTSNNQMTTTKT